MDELKDAKTTPGVEPGRHLRLVSFALCPYVHRATIVLREKGAAFDIDYVDLADKPEWFRLLSPRGKVPVLVVDGTAIFESAAINEFLDETLPPPLMPTSPLERARHRGWVEVANDLFAAQYKIVSAETKEDHQAALSQTETILGRFEGAVSGDFFGGDHFSLVDAAVAPVLFKLVLLERRAGLRFAAGSPKVEAWGRRLAARPSVVNGVLPDFEAKYIESVQRRGGYFAREVLGRLGVAR